ncbi:MAG: glycosyltransferase [Thermodesulfobacteriota bacterium]
MNTTLIYMQNTVYPSSKAHTIQISKTLKSLSPYFNIEFIVNEFSCPANKLHRKTEEIYGLNINNIKFRAIPKKRLRGLWFPGSLKKILKNIAPPRVFYTRSYNTAYRLIKTQKLHRSPIILESHKKDGYFKEENVATERYNHLLKDNEKNNTPLKKLKFIYKNINGITFTSKTSQQTVERDLSISNSTCIWYPLTPTTKNTLKNKNIVFCGTLAPQKMEDLLLDSAQNWPNDIKIDVLGGGGEKNIERFLTKAKNRGISHHFQFYPVVPYREVGFFLGQYKLGLALMEGLKVIDYIANDVVPIVPKINTYTDYLNDKNAFFYKPYSPSSLTNKLLEAVTLDTDSKDIETLKNTYALKNYGKNLSEFINSTALNFYEKK